MKCINHHSNHARRLSSILLLFALPLYAQEYTIGVPVCDTISTMNAYSHNSFCDDRFDDTLKIMLHSNLIPYVTGLQFQLLIVAVNGRISSTVSDTVKAGDIFHLPAPNASGIYKFVTTPNSSFQYITKIIGTPLIANEEHFCNVREAMTAAVCNNTLSYFGQGQKCKVKPMASIDDFSDTQIEYNLAQNYPNPFNPETTIRFQIAASAFVTIKIYNVLAQPIRTLLAEKRAAGVYQLTWDGRDEADSRVNGGVYFCVMKTDEFHQTRKILFLP
ncbi:MAG: T9SS type A sorting domain-containing protein [bacterium]